MALGSSAFEMVARQLVVLMVAVYSHSTHRETVTKMNTWLGFQYILWVILPVLELPPGSTP